MFVCWQALGGVNHPGGRAKQCGSFPSSYFYLCFEYLTQTGEKGSFSHLESFQNTKRIWSRGKCTHSSQFFFQWSKQTNKTAKTSLICFRQYMHPFRGSCHLFISSRQQLPATNSSCHPAKGHFSIFMKSSENFKAKEMTKYLTAFICFLAIFTPMPCKYLPEFPANVLLFIQVLLSTQGTSLVIYILQMEKLRPWSLCNMHIVGPNRARNRIMVGLKLSQVPREGQWPWGKWERIPILCMPAGSRAQWEMWWPRKT